MSIKIVLENALAQLKAQKDEAYKNAYANKLAEYDSEFNEYRIQKQQELQDAENALKASYENALKAKKAEIEQKADYCAKLASGNVDKMIDDLQKMIDSNTEV